MSYVEELRKIVGTIPLILVGSVVIITDEENKILLQKRMHHPVGRYGLPGGLMELGESTIETAQREVYEETGLTVRNLKLIDVFSGKENFIKAPNGDEFYVVVTAYWTKEYSGTLEVNDEESMSLEFFNIDDLPENIAKSHREMINKYRNLLTSR
ncbi:DNA mismatch repair protein MutT [Paenibacillus marchantiophytorum]|uniref:DNA mismatch repair protein MutT n=1 Tax=Paenibacillus marchantiophytorum TaxID=1619310 RepID=A0ABQ1EZB2_9BACL|nr:NUDIX hydrolase [Paenibacillus marchantiophytorum]GFZ93373.1 DNA mismatch repair protein MutT [Paenibacillus marchantiophytorum]